MGVSKRLIIQVLLEKKEHTKHRSTFMQLTKGFIREAVLDIHAIY